MNNIEATRIVAVIETNWTPYKSTQAAIDLWASSFADEPFELVNAAVQALVQTDTSGFRPNVGQVREEMRNILYGRPMTETEAWLAVKGCFHEAQEGAETLRGAKAAWKKLPEDIQKLVTPRQLMDWNGIETEQLDTVIQSNFMRSYREIRKTRHAKEMMSKSLLSVIEKIQKASPVFEDHDAPKNVPALEAPKYELPAEWNRNREISPETLAKLADFGGFDD